jgi:NAD-dependent deacetylase
VKLLNSKQNIDHLHEASGIPRDKIISLHGSEDPVMCVQCHKEIPREEVHQRILKGEKAPRCQCGGANDKDRQNSYS